ncbi:ANTAR domain-containing protein [Amycolatopsis sp. CA-126428]|uniref:ANTAR domain-containing protein n=1 Tax=Amycolatopsis sp. CA-126428 TaxID=2073158 RepID=UPI0013048396|nr:ANTAR domain-containing protein [Amycolatopsis sp. CA-126428]
MDAGERGVRYPPWSAELVPAGERPVVVVTGELDLSAGPGFGDRVQELAADLADPVVDLSRVTLLTASGVRQLHAVADALAAGGRCLRVVSGTGIVLRVLRAAQATDVIDTYVTLGAAEKALRRLAPDGPAELDRLRDEVADLRSKLATRPVIARALGILQERYRLADMDEAFRLLRYASRNHNVKLVVLAKALVELPRPRDRTWLIGPLQRQAPSLSFAVDRSGKTPATVLELLLQVTLDRTGAAAGYAQLPHETGAGLRLAAVRGLGAEFTKAFAHLDGEQSTCTAARVSGAAVISAHIARDPLYCRPDTRHVLLGVGFAAACSIPLQGHTAGCAGVLTTLHEAPGPVLDGPEWERVHDFCRETGAWLHWYRHREVLAALQDLHARVTAGQLR